jgi:integrase
MPTTYDVRIWPKFEEYTGKRGTTYTVRWSVAGKWQRSKPPFTSFNLADSFRSELKQAVNKGEPFDIETGLPVSMLKRAATETTWYEFALSFTDHKWKRASAVYRRDIARTLVTVTTAMLRAQPSAFSAQQMRKALRDWAFNTEHRENAPYDVTDILAWVKRNSLPMAAFDDTETFAAVMTALAVNLDGKTAAGSTIRRNRNILHNALGYAVKRHLLAENPLTLAEDERVRAVRAIDKRRLVNPTQARALLAAVKTRKPSGRHVHAFLAVMYYAGLRPEEVVSLYVRDLALPESENQDTDSVTPEDDGWGEITVSEPRPEIGKRWTDSGEVRDRRSQPKGREKGEVRYVPVHPELVTILREYIARLRLGPGPRLFTGVRSGNDDLLSALVVRRAWTAVRLTVLGEDVAGKDGTTVRKVTTLCGKKIYDLRHACLTGWLNSGVPAPQVAEWAGNSVPVLLGTYAKCISGQEADYKRRITESLRQPDQSGRRGASGRPRKTSAGIQHSHPQEPGDSRSQPDSD